MVKDECRKMKGCGFGAYLALLVEDRALDRWRARPFDRSRNSAGSRRMTGLRVTAQGRWVFTNACFCETNPPFWRDFSGASASIQNSYDGKFREKSVGSFWKTNPPGGGF